MLTDDSAYTDEFKEWFNETNRLTDDQMRSGCKELQKRIEQSVLANKPLFPVNAFEFKVLCLGNGRTPVGGVNHAAYMLYNDPKHPMRADRGLTHGTAEDRKETAKSAINDIMRDL